MDATNNAVEGALRLQPFLDIDAAPTLLHELRSQLQAGHVIQIDASRVELLAFPCAQILLAAAQPHGQVQICDPSDAFVMAVENLGFDELKASFGSLDEAVLPVTDANDNASDVAGASAELEAAELDAKAKRVLTIDDSKTMRDMLLLTLADAGFDVLQAVDGQDGLDVLNREKVDVVITDINMPRMDGYEVVRQVRCNPAFDRLPVLVLTTESDPDKRDVARGAGATGWMVKPFDPERLVATVRKVCA
jgi:two-component system chemotaxis response regulator CheY